MEGYLWQWISTQKSYLSLSTRSCSSWWLTAWHPSYLELLSSKAHAFGAIHPFRSPGLSFLRTWDLYGLGCVVTFGSGNAIVCSANIRKFENTLKRHPTVSITRQKANSFRYCFTMLDRWSRSPGPYEFLNSLREHRRELRFTEVPITIQRVRTQLSPLTVRTLRRAGSEITKKDAIAT